MSRKKKAPTIIQDAEVQWNDDDFNLDSFGEESRLPDEEIFQKLREDGFKPENVSIDIQEKYAKYLERMTK
jgi:hypothetical protein